MCIYMIKYLTNRQILVIIILLIKLLHSSGNVVKVALIEKYYYL